METVILSPSEQNLIRCAQRIKEGGIVAFPTETVYGLGASVYNEVAVRKIFEAKGRPNDNPLIVHICDKSQLEGLTSQINETAKKLIDAFMPGAITLVFKKRPTISDIVTGGLDTVAIRMPNNETALEFIKKCGVPICAPSANKSSLPSATKAKHVYDDLKGKVRYIIDGGQCQIGLESTVVDVTNDTPRLLRNGGITIEQLEGVVGKVEICHDNSVALSPGMKYKHYSPHAEVFFSAFYGGMEATINEVYDRLVMQGKNPVILCLSDRAKLYNERNIIEVGADYNDYAKNLFSVLRQADEKDYDSIIAEGVSSKDIGATIINRLIKSSGGQII